MSSHVAPPIPGPHSDGKFIAGHYMEIMKSWPDLNATPHFYATKKLSVATLALQASANHAAMPRMRVQLYNEGESYFARFDACERSVAGFMPLTTTLDELMRAMCRKLQRAPRLPILLHPYLRRSMGEEITAPATSSCHTATTVMVNIKTEAHPEC